MFVLVGLEKALRDEAFTLLTKIQFPNVLIKIINDYVTPTVEMYNSGESRTIWSTNGIETKVIADKLPPAMIGASAGVLYHMRRSASSQIPAICMKRNGAISSVTLEPKSTTIHTYDEGRLILADRVKSHVRLRSFDLTKPEMPPIESMVVPSSNLNILNGIATRDQRTYVSLGEFGSSFNTFLILDDGKVTGTIEFGDWCWHIIVTKSGFLYADMNNMFHYNTITDVTIKVSDMARCCAKVTQDYRLVRYISETSLIEISDEEVDTIPDKGAVTFRPFIKVVDVVHPYIISHT